MKKGDDFDVFPVVHTKITKNTELPKSLDELNNNCDFVRYVRCPGTGLFKYKSINFTDSTRVLKKLIFIGNYALDKPMDEFIEKDIGFPIDGIRFANYEEDKINSYVKLRNK